ncbi:hypothetical protein OpiT1DRAFT_04259 [Opitutaceae bacterium TAV1]|nr:hypothetical protein OPIT5_05525 [Opitutaceae bacterium TAV5]EIP99730.1 hypothetical protein OpiT1DRAFT_04259 [Opitutaceae bacterium TAV1]
MKHYTFARTFRVLYDKAVGLYAKGQRGADTFFNEQEQAWLAANGITPQHLYDYAEDQNGDGEPGYDIALGIEGVRRDYFLNIQGGQPSPGPLLDEASLPPKDASVAGIVWLPRIIPKARAKLHGELPASLMYCCGGDRHFFKSNDIYPAEFLSLVWRAGNNDQAIIDQVARRIASRS